MTCRPERRPGASGTGAGVGGGGDEDIAGGRDGVGAPVVEFLKKADLGAQLKPVVITGGEAVGQLPHAVTAPRRTLRVPEGLANCEKLRRELLGLGRPGSRERDDMAFALALACWGLAPMGEIGFAPNRLF